MATDGFFSADELRARLGVSTVVIDEDTPLDCKVFSSIAGAGIATVEIIDRRDEFHEEDPASMAGVVAACRGAGLTVTSFHSRSVQFQERGVEAEVARSRRMVDHLLSIGGTVWGTHAAIEEPETTEGYAALAEHYADEDLSLVVENFARPGQQIEDVIAWLDRMDHARVGMILDVGHELTDEGENVFTVAGQPTRLLRAIGPRLRHIHLHDWRDGRDHHAPFTGALQWVEVFRGLRETDYGGAVLFEPGPGPDTLRTLWGVGEVPERIVAMAAG